MVLVSAVCWVGVVLRCCFAPGILLLLFVWLWVVDV